MKTFFSFKNSIEKLPVLSICLTECAWVVLAMKKITYENVVVQGLGFFSSMGLQHFHRGITLTRDNFEGLGKMLSTEML